MTKAADRPGSAEIVAAKVAREEAWIWDVRARRITMRQAVKLTERPVDEGGLGYRLSLATLKSRFDSFAAQMRPLLEANLEHARQRQLAELDELARAAQIALSQAARGGKLDVAAARLLIDIQIREAKILGSDAADRLQVEVTQRDGVLEEMNAALVALGREPVEEI